MASKCVPEILDQFKGQGHDEAQESCEGHDQGQECYPSLPSPTHDRNAAIKVEFVNDHSTEVMMEIKGYYEYLVSSKMNENQADNQAESDKEQEGIVHVKTKENVSDGNGVPEPVDQSQGEAHQEQEWCRIGFVSNQTDSSLCQDENNNTTRSMASQGVSEPCDQSNGEQHDKGQGQESNPSVEHGQGQDNQAESDNEQEGIVHVKTKENVSDGNGVPEEQHDQCEVQYQGQTDRLMGSVSNTKLSSPCKAISDPCCSSKQFKSPKKDLLIRWNVVEFLDGCIEYVLFAGEPKQDEWDKENILTYFFQTPQKISLVIRFSKNATINQILEALVRKWKTFGVRFQDPFITFRGHKLDGDFKIFDIPPKSALIIFDKEVNEEYTRADGTHSGKPWTCKLCGRGFTTQAKFANHARSKEHVPLPFKQQTSFARIFDRHVLPWGCPKNARDPRPWKKIFESADPG